MYYQVTMKRVLVIGLSGAGKSWLARRMGEKTGLPVIHLDSEYWLPGWTNPQKRSWVARVRRLVSRKRWIMDGNFGGTQDLRMKRADTIIFLDFPRWRCFLNVFRRWATYYGRRRPDLAPGCPEQLDFEFLKWVWGFHEKTRPALQKRLRKFKRGRRIVILRSPREIRLFLARI